MTDYSLWEVIKNGNKVLRRTIGTVKQEYELTTAEEKQDRRNEMKARATLLITLPNKDQLKFHSYQDAKLLMEAIEKRHGGNKESKKVQRTLLKQQYENFAALSSEIMDQTFDSLQKLISQLEIQGEVINQEDMNLKLLRSLPSEWKTHALIWRNKVEIETISLDDLYNNLKIYEPELTGSSSTSQNSQNVAFVSNNTNNTNITNKANNNAHGVSTAQGNGVNSTYLDNLYDAVICAFLASQPNSPQLAQEDLEQRHPDDLEEMDLQWEMAMLAIRARRFPWSQENKGRENNLRTVPIETPTQNALIAQDGIGGYNWSYQAEEEQPTNHALMAFTSSGSSSSSDSEVDSCSKTCVKAYATLKEQYDSLSFDYKKSQFNLVSYKACLESVEARLAHYKKNEAVFEESINVLKLEVRLRDNALDEYKMKLEKAEKERDQLKQTLEKFQHSSKSLNDLLEIESFVNLSDKTGSNKGYHSVPPPLTGNFIPRKPDLTFIDEIVESENMDVTTVITPSNDKTVENKGVSNTVESNAVRMNNSSAPIIEDWNSDDESEVEPNDKTVRPNTEKTVRETDAPKQNKHHPRGNQRNWNNLMSQRLGSDFKIINKACYVYGSFEHFHYVCDKKVVRPVWNNSRRVNHKNFSNKMTHPHPKRSFVPQAVLTRTGKINTTGTNVNTVGASISIVITQLILLPQLQLVKNTTARDRAVVSKNKGKWANAVKALACWGNPQQKEYKEKAVIDSGCLRHMTGNKCYLNEYEDYDGGFVSFSNGKGRISGKVPRKDNIYSVDLKSVVPTGGLTCLIAKATIDKSNTWHKRLGHINFKIMNKLVKGNLVKGLPSNIFENDHSCVACQKGKQHKAFYKTKLVNSISKPLHMLHMDLFGPTNVKSLMKKSYCLVVTNDFSRFSWVFFLATKDETSGILKTFITEIENQLYHKVKVIRCDNGTEFKNSIMNQFCEIKGIKREFSVARTPQQNGVAERKNRTLIEAARTMVLVIKPHNKTHYELIHGRPPLIDFMKPFGYPVTILNTRDHLGKFDGKADEGYFVGYSVVSKAMRVFNKRTMIVEETLNIRFLENTPNVKGNRPDWLFDVDSLTISMNYVPVVAGNQTNGIAGTKDNIVAGQAQKEKEPKQEDAGMKPTEVDENEASDKSGKHDQATRSESERLNQREMQTEHTNNTNNINTVSTPVSTAGPSFDNVSS
ncbi:putative ribonuclease H-like domain-containing protein [Tanacetum coccineum]